MVNLIHDNRENPFVEAAGIELAPRRKHKLVYKKKKTFLLSSPYTTYTDKVSLLMQVMLSYYNAADY
jgi:hypothetical protein